MQLDTTSLHRLTVLNLTTTNLHSTHGNWWDLPPVLDVTVKSGVAAFAPTWDLVMGYKEGRLTSCQYREQYYALMRKSYAKDPDTWLALLNSERVALGCYCNPGDFCHRLLLVDILTKLGESLGITINYLGEYPHDEQ